MALFTTVIIMAGTAQFADARDLEINTTCLDGTWTATVLDADGLPQKNTRILVYDSIRTSGPPEASIFSNHMGQATIRPDQNAGWVKINYSGYIEIVMPTNCAVPPGTIPTWIRDLTLFWTDSMISDQEYSASLTWLASRGIIDVQEPFPDCNDIFGSYIIHEMASVALPEIHGIPRYISTQAADTAHTKYELFADHCQFTGNNLKMSKLLDTLRQKIAVIDFSTCIIFCDSTGYEPRWAKTMGQNQAMQACWSVGLSPDYSSKDWKWCNELSGYVMDSLPGYGDRR